MESDVVGIRVDTLCELKHNMQPGVSPWIASGKGTTITATTMAPYVINLEKKRVFPEREINTSGKHGINSRSSRRDFNFLWRIVSYRLSQKVPFRTDRGIYVLLL